MTPTRRPPLHGGATGGGPILRRDFIVQYILLCLFCATVLHNSKLDMKIGLILDINRKHAYLNPLGYVSKGTTECALLPTVTHDTQVYFSLVVSSLL